MGEDTAEGIAEEGAAPELDAAVGRALVADPFGRILAKAGTDSEEVLTAVCDPKLQEETRRNWPFLRDRRIDAYAPISQRYLDP